MILSPKSEPTSLLGLDWNDKEEIMNHNNKNKKHLRESMNALKHEIVQYFENAQLSVRKQKHILFLLYYYVVLLAYIILILLVCSSF